MSTSAVPPFCVRNQRFFHGSAYLSEPHLVGTAENASNLCQRRCRGQRECRNFMFNRYGKCYLLTSDTANSTVSDDSRHGTVSCSLERHAQMQAKLLTLLREPSAFARPPAVRALHAAFGIVARAFNETAQRSRRSRAPFETFVLNLDASVDRMRGMSAKLRSAHLPTWRRVPAVIGADLDLRTLARVGLIVRERTAANNVALVLSHVQIWRALAHATILRRRVDAKRSLPSALILEDDAILLPGFALRLPKLLAGLNPLHYDLCSLYFYAHLTDRSRCVHPSHVLGDRATSIPVVRLECLNGLNTGTVAYLISPGGARRALRHVLPVRTTLDLQLGEASTRLRWYAVAPHARLAEHDFSMRSVRVHGPSDRSSVRVHGPFDRSWSVY